MDQCLYSRNVGQESNRKSYKDKMAIKTFRGPQERTRKETYYPRFINFKQNDLVSQVQNVDIKGSSQESSLRNVYMQHRPKGRLLACSHNTQVKAFSGICLPRPIIPIQGYALRTQYRATNFHKVDFRSYQNNLKKRGMDLTILRRYPYHITYKGTESIGYSNYLRGPGRFRVFDQHRKIKIDPCSKVSVVGNSVGYRRDNILQYPPRNSSEFAFFNRNGLSSSHYKETSNEASRFSQLDSRDRSLLQTFDGNNQKTSQNDELGQKQKFSHNFTPVLSCTNKVMDSLPRSSSSLRNSRSRLSYHDRRFSVGMGHCDRRKKISGPFRPFNELFNKCERVVSSLDGSSFNRSKRSINSSTCRQYSSYLCYKKGICKNLSPQISSRTCEEEVKVSRTDTRYQTHKRCIQRSFRPIVQELNNSDRMVSSSKSFQHNDSQEISQSGMGLICNFSKQQTPQICLPLSRPGSSSSRCIYPKLEHPQECVHVSSNSLDFEGFRETDIYIAKGRNSYNKAILSKTMVCPSSPNQQVPLYDFNQTSASSRRQNCHSRLSHGSTRLEALKTAFDHLFPGEQEIIDFLTSTIRPSSIRDYQTKFKIFMIFLKKENISLKQLKLVHVLKFFVELFNNNRTARTIYSYRSALAQPLKWCFDIDLSSQHVTDILKAMVLRRPNNPPKEIKWDLNDLLSFMDNTQIGNNEVKALQISAILLLLATGWRISELHACVRNSEFLSIDHQFVLKIRPHEAFMAKNEKPNDRWDHVIIKPLFLQNGQRSQLCPILNLQRYLDLSYPDKSGSLFKLPGSQLPMPIYTLSRLICQFINTACPRSSAKVHDIRKFASSIALIKCLDITFVTSTMKWSSPSTFIKFYLSPTTVPQLQIVTPGQT